MSGSSARNYRQQSKPKGFLANLRRRCKEHLAIGREWANTAHNAWYLCSNPEFALIGGMKNTTIRFVACSLLRWLTSHSRDAKRLAQDLPVRQLI